VPAPGDHDDGEIGGIIGRGNWWNNWQEKQKYSENTYYNASLSTTNSTCCPDANPGRGGGKPATNRLSYGAANFYSYPHIIRMKKSKRMRRARHVERMEEKKKAYRILVRKL
jgi:hypothetical protein